MKYVCLNCGSVDKSKTKVKGSIGIEIVLWIFFIVPGIIYSIWRWSSVYKVCRVCGNANIVPMDSPKGREMIAKNNC